MELSHFIIGIIIFGMVLLGFTSFMYDMGSNKYYNTNFSSDYDDVYATVNQSLGVATAYDLGLNASDSLEESSGIGVKDTAVILTEGAIQALKTPFLAMKIIPKLISTIALKLGVPAWFITGIISILVVTLIFLILNAFLSWKVS